MNETSLSNRIARDLASGKTREAIYRELLQENHSLETIETQFEQLKSHSHKEDTQHRAIQVIVTIGVLLIGAGIFSFIASNWEEMGRVAKILVILVAMVGVTIAGWKMVQNGKHIKSGHALLLLGSCIFGAGIFLIGQMFHIRANWPDGFAIWMLGTMAMAFATESTVLFLLTLPLGFTAIVGSWSIVMVSNVWSPGVFLHTPLLLLVLCTAALGVAAMAIRRKMPDELKKVF